MNASLIRVDPGGVFSLEGDAERPDTQRERLAVRRAISLTDGITHSKKRHCATIGERPQERERNYARGTRRGR
jgi:hypothetical protein